MNEAMALSTAIVSERNNNISNTIKSIGQRLFGFIRKRVTSTEDAEDIFQDVLYQFAGSAEPIEHASGWLFRVARNKITDSYRKHRLPLADDVFGNGSTEEDGFNWKEMLLPSDSTPESEYLRNLFWEALHSALEELPEEQSSVFIQNEIEGIPFKEIAETTGVAVATLISRKRYAVLHLRDRLQVLKDELLNA